MARQYDLVKTLGLAIGVDADALCIAGDAVYRRVQALVGDVRNNFFYILARTTRHRPPLRTVAYLDKTMVVAEADHGRHRKLQHLVRGAAPNATQHGQKIPVTKFVGQMVLA